MISKNSLLLFTTIHPYGEKYLAQLIKNINEQTYQNFKVFFCFNNLKIKKEHLKEINKLQNKFIILKTNLPPVKSRIISLKKIIKYNFNIIIFLDCDDLMHKKRIEKLHPHLNRNDFIVNNLKNFDNKKNYFNDIKKKINMKSIIENNYIGLSNLTIKKKSLKKIINELNPKLKILDWQMATLLFLKRQKGIFLKNSITYYRQHENNFYKNCNNSSEIFKQLKIKKEHYKFFQKYNNVYKNKYEELKNIKKYFYEKKLYKYKSSKKKTRWLEL
jgi:hypothetical protein